MKLSERLKRAEQVDAEGISGARFDWTDAIRDADALEQQLAAALESEIALRHRIRELEEVKGATSTWLPFGRTPTGLCKPDCGGMKEGRQWCCSTYCSNRIYDSQTLKPEA